MLVICTAECLNMGCPYNIRNNMDGYSSIPDHEDLSDTCYQYLPNVLDSNYYSEDKLIEELDFN